MAVKTARNGLMVDGRLLPLISGSVHYWRLDRELWPSILDSVKKLGFDIICTYVPWSVHEIEKGQFDFGHFDRRHDLGAFLKTAHKAGLKAIVRPGPHINAELTLFGYPERVLRRRELIAVTADGAPAWLPAFPKAFPIPSYACEEFYAEVGVFFDSVCRILAPLKRPDGPIVAIQADNENSNFFRTQPWDMDYHPESVALYRRFLAEKYAGIEALNAAYSSSYKSFDAVAPPRAMEARSPDRLRFHMDWIEYIEYYIAYGVGRIADMLRERGFDDVPVTHNFPAAVTRPPFDTRRLENGPVDIQGVDMYPRKEQYEAVKIGFRKLAAESRLPFAPEFGSGFWTNDLQRPITLQDQKFCTAAAFMNGLRAVNFYMIVERERWYGSPIARDGRIRKEYYDYYQTILKTLRRTELWDLELHAQALLLMEPDYWRLTLASSMASPISLDLMHLAPEFWVMEDEFGLGENLPMAHDRVWNMFFHGLTYSKTPFAVSTSRMPAEYLSRFKAVLAPSFAFMDAALQARLLDYARAGGALVIGPRVPALDEFFAETQDFTQIFGRADRRVPRSKLLAAPFMDIDLYDGMNLESTPIPLVARKLGKGSVTLLPMVPAAIPNEAHRQTYGEIVAAALAPARIEPPVEFKSFRVDYAMLEGQGRRILFLANPTARRRQVKFSFPGKRPKVKEIPSRQRARRKVSHTVQLPPFGIRMWEVS